ncbi:thioredoxin [Arthrobacter sp. HMSC08H08]|uniref:thioredoxin n=1 Tax=Arthrobacter sp. HMSC08H08 TaxID=1581143 RepID=UPI0008A13E3B|nr:thioredoxin [Arthrobacter sp. HMSC08H08]OFT23050.1 thiol reductase thioredoxin [Arthrobacter sp. HMSC08H08]
MSNVIDVTEADFEEKVLKNEKTVLVDFWAEWCGPCRALGPVLEEIQEENGGKLQVVKVNVDENQGIAAKYGITSIPAVFAFKGGEHVATSIGAKPKAQLLDAFKDHI